MSIHETMTSDASKATCGTLSVCCSGVLQPDDPIPIEEMTAALDTRALVIQHDSCFVGKANELSPLRATWGRCGRLKKSCLAKFCPKLLRCRSRLGTGGMGCGIDWLWTVDAPTATSFASAGLTQLAQERRV